MKKALILIDVQNDYFPKGKMELHNMESASRNCAELLKIFRKKKLPVFHIQHIAIKPSATFFLPNTEGVKIHASVQPLEGELIVEKNFPNSFRNTILLEELRKHKIEHLVIAGAMTHMCIDATTRAAYDFGFSCEVIGNACATKNLEWNGKTVNAEDVHVAFLAALDNVYAQVHYVDTYEFLDI